MAQLGKVDKLPYVKIDWKEITDYAWTTIDDQNKRKNNKGIRKFIKMMQPNLKNKIIIGKNFDLFQLS